MADYIVNETVTESFRQIEGITGLVAGDFDIVLIHNASISAVPVTLAEISNGYYSVSFTPNAVGTWSIDINLATEPKVRYQKTFYVDDNAELSQIQTDIVAIQAGVTNLDGDVAALQNSVDNLNDPSVPSIVDGVLDELVSDHLLPGSVGDYLNRTKKYVANRIVKNSGVYSVKEDDGSTEFEAGTISNIERKPN